MGKMEDYLNKECQDINYTVVRPPGLTNQPSKGNKTYHCKIFSWIVHLSSSIQSAEACSTEQALAKIPYTRNTNFGERSQALTLLNSPQVIATLM